jgi:hypothetical protein
MARPKRLLGIVVGERSMLVAEVPSDRQTAAPPRLATFVFPDGITLDTPEALGSSFADFLSKNDFGAKEVVIGVPVRQLVARQVELPPTDPGTAAQLLWLQTPVHFSGDLGAMAFDFAGETSAERASTVNLFGLQQNYLARLVAFAESAGLKPIAVNATIAALAAATISHVRDAICLSVCNDGVELAICDGASAPLLKHVAPSSAIPRLITELRRHAAGSPSSNNQPGQRKLVLWDGCGLDDDAKAAIGQAANTAIIPGDVRWLDASASASDAGAPLALLLPARKGQRLSPDFLHPRIVPAKERSLSTRTMAICAGIAAVLLVALIGWVDVLHIQRQITASRGELDSLAPQLAIARPFASQMQFVKTFQPGQTSYLKCLKDLTISIPQGGQTYLTSFVLENDMKGACVGHSGSDQDVLDLLDKLNATGRFAGLNRKLDSRAKGNLADVLFTINFSYAPDQKSVATNSTN